MALELPLTPARWSGRDDFTVLDLGFATSRDFLAAWRAWRADPARPARLHYIGVQPTPSKPVPDPVDTSLEDLAAELRRRWPPALAGWHPIDLEDGRVRLLLVFGEMRAVFKSLDVTADDIRLDGSAPWDAQALRALARFAAPGATVTARAATASVRAGLRSAGFEFEPNGAGEPGTVDEPGPLRGRYAPAPTVRRPRQHGMGRPGAAVVIGAGLAGGWAAHGLLQQGWSVRVLERRPEPAAEASGNPAGLFHGTVNADDGPHARFHRAAALLAERTLRPWIENGRVPGRIDGLLRLASEGDTLDTLQAPIDRHGLPPGYVQAVDAAMASALAGIALNRPAWFYPGGGWLEPPALVRHLLRDAEFEGGVEVERVERDGAVWRLFDAADGILAETATLVLANAAAAMRLWPQAAWPMGRSRGQLSQWPRPPADAPHLRRPVAGGGYVLSLADGGLLCGATAAAGDEDTTTRTADHRFNLDRLQQMTGWPGPLPPEGRVGWRANTVDRLPLVGPVPASGLAPGQSSTRKPTTQLLRAEREPGLFVLSGLGARGLTWGPLAGRMLAAWIGGTPMPVEAELRDAADPARWLVRAARRNLQG